MDSSDRPSREPEEEEEDGVNGEDEAEEEEAVEDARAVEEAAGERRGEAAGEATSAESEVDGEELKEETVDGLAASMRGRESDSVVRDAKEEEEFAVCGVVVVASAPPDAEILAPEVVTKDIAEDNRCSRRAGSRDPDASSTALLFTV